MRCVICKKTIGNRETRDYIRVYRDSKARKVYGCLNCRETFDRLIDSLPTDEGGSPIDVSRSEWEALKVAINRKALEKRLRSARSCLALDIRCIFGKGHFDFDNRLLIGNNGLILQWRTRRKPTEPESYGNQQTTEGAVYFLPPKTSEFSTCEI